MNPEHHPAPNARVMSEAEYRAAKAEILRRIDGDRLRQRDAADLARVKAKNAAKQES